MNLLASFISANELTMLCSVRRASASAVKTCFGDRTSYALETFDVKVTTIKDIKSRLDVRLLVKRSDNGMNSCKVLLVKMNEIKDVTLDVQNLHRLNTQNY